MQFDMLTVPGNNEFKIVQVNKNVDMTWSNKNLSVPWRLQRDVEILCVYMCIHNLANINASYCMKMLK